PRTPGSAEEPPDPAEHPPPSRPDGAPAATQRVPQPLADGGPYRAVPIAGTLGLGAGEERLTPHLGAAGRREESGGGIDVPPDDVVGDLERTSRPRPGRRAHEVDPDGQRALGAGAAAPPPAGRPAGAARRAHPPAGGGGGRRGAPPGPGGGGGAPGAGGGRPGGGGGGGGGGEERGGRGGGGGGGGGRGRL